MRTSWKLPWNPIRALRHSQPVPSQVPHAARAVSAAPPAPARRIRRGPLVVLIVVLAVVAAFAAVYFVFFTPDSPPPLHLSDTAATADAGATSAPTARPPESSSTTVRAEAGAGGAATTTPPARAPATTVVTPTTTKATASSPSPSTTATAAAGATPATTAAGAAASAGPAPTAADPVGTWKVASGSLAGYRVREKLAGLPAESDAVGRTTDGTGTATIARSGTALAVSAARFDVNLLKLESDDGRRDSRIRSQGLESSRFPTATFVLATPIPLP